MDAGRHHTRTQLWARRFGDSVEALQSRDLILKSLPFLLGRGEPLEMGVIFPHVVSFLGWGLGVMANIKKLDD